MGINIAQLKGKHVYLELFQSSHVETIRQLAKNARIWEFTRGITVNEDYDKHFDKYIQQALDTNDLTGQQAFLIRRTSDNAIIGMTRYYLLNSKDRKINIGYTWYIPEVWGKVYNKECKLLMFQYAFETMKLNRAELVVDGLNVRSQKAVEKVGGVREGTYRKHSYRNDGTVRDMVVFSIIDDEWQAKKEKLLQMIAEAEKQ